MRILLVDDSMLVRSMMKALFSLWEGFEVIGEAANGQACIQQATLLNPDLILMDVNMPVLNGIEATRQIMNSHPVPIVIFTSEETSVIGYQAIDAGALDVIPKPDLAKMNDPDFTKEFKVVLNNVVKFGALKIKGRSPPEGRESPVTVSQASPYRLLVVGASTGGPSAVRTLLSDLPGNFPLPILLSQHIEMGFDQGYADWLNDATELQVRLAGESQSFHPGEVWVARATHHLLCTKGRAFLDDGPRVDNQKPSVDTMFISAAAAYGSQLMGVLLTGMGRDGAKGCKTIRDKGGFTLVQSQDSSMIFGMPKAAIEIGGASKVLALEEMGPALRRVTRG